jgi:hypothetical protein
MTDAAIDYLRPAPDDFWRWDADGKVLQWIDGRTIAFLPEVHTAAARFKTTGLPPFGALALALAAMRDPWAADDAQRGAFAGFVRAALSPGAELPGLLQDLLRDARARLDALAALPADLRGGVKEGRALLAEMLFEGVAPTLPKTHVPAVLAVLSQRVPEPADAPVRASAAEALAVLKSLAAARLLTNGEAVRLRLQTGLEQLPGAAPVHVSDAVRSLLHDLRGDPQLAGLARLARDMLAVLATPRRLAPQRDLPLGGFADLSNRGPLDRLLLTELAHDDLTLAVRVAMNEALFLRRESPRTPQAFARTLLLDSGIRLWGVPRVFAAAVALAVAATTPKEATLTVVAAARDKLLPVDLTSRAGLLAHLERLDPSPHPGAALPALAAHLKRARGRDDETFLLTHPDAAADPDFQKALHAAGLFPHFEATVDDAGRFALAVASAAGRRRLQEATLNLHEILDCSPPSPAAPAALVAPHADLPAFFRLPTSPFHTPAVANLRRAVSSPARGLIAVAGRALMQWAGGRPRTLLQIVPAGNFVGLKLFEPRGDVVHAVYDVIDRRLHTASVNLASPHSHEQKTALPAEPIAMGAHNGVVLLFSLGRCDAYAADRFSPVGSVEYDRDSLLIGDRFLIDPGGNVEAVSYEGPVIRLRRLDFPPRPVLVFACPAADGPAALYADGSVLTSTGRTLVPAAGWDRGASHHSSRASADGARLVADIPGPGFRDTTPYALDLAHPTPAWRPIAPAEADRFLLGPAADLAAADAARLRRRMVGICLDAAGDLALVSRRQKVLAIDHRHNYLRPAGRLQRATRHRPLAALPAAAAAPLPGLQTAAWADGSCAWMDPRGLLHLRSSDRAVPELSILLAEAARSLTAWSSDGKTYGQESFLHAPPTGSHDDLRRHLSAFLARLA